MKETELNRIPDQKEENVREVRKESKVVNIPPHKYHLPLWKCNVITGEVVEATTEKEVHLKLNTNSGVRRMDVLEVEDGCIYGHSLNKKNATRKFQKWIKKYYKPNIK